MLNLMKKEMTLAASPLSYLFIAAAFLTFVPGYPILLGAFFTTLGIFYSFQTVRENNDILFSLLLPVSKAEVVKAKYFFVLGIEGVSFLLMTLMTLIRMICLSKVAAYTSNALMNANFVFLGFALLLFGMYNWVFLGGFFKTAVNYGKPFVLYCVISLVVIFAAEALHFFPGCEMLNTTDFSHPALQMAVFSCGLLLCIGMTVLSLKKSIHSFEQVDL